jgi:protein tyrosine phosphatase
MKLIAPQDDSLYGNASAIYEDDVAKQIKPLVIHCNTGLGRTGTLCAILICLKRLLEEQKVDLYTVCSRLSCDTLAHCLPQTVKHMRTQRTGMVQTAVCQDVIDAPSHSFG